MPRSRAQRDADHQVVIAALTEANPGGSLRLDQVVEAATGQRHPAEWVTNRVRADLRALERAGRVVEEISWPGQLWTSWRLARPEDEDEREDRADVERMLRAWEPA